uniref:Basic phospholipase A2 n=1 Tax=Porthidium ophryomegas TaxID=44717 RepID=PA2_POROP|nr:RecName: Full=Basic phospholipase A2; Short=PoPLA2; Short=PophPLA2; Short=svPLA2; AltName: Full=Phosphatidylcholine 2-acylhydrolase [Porthidium ophryomegas]
NLFQFRKMIKKMTKKEPVVYYAFYGCYCGKGGRGKPKDATDRCCFVHDCCYEKVTGCNPKWGYYTYSMNKQIVCGGDDPCKKQVCECDKAAAICFRDNLKTYKKKYMSFPNFFCTDPSEKC